MCIRDRPFGVSAQIIPWNYPLEMTARGISAALATANACVVKTPELDPISNIWLARAAEAVGPGIERREFGTNMGAMVSDPQRDRAERLVEAAAAKGATVATGGRRLNLPGSFLAPTVISGVTPDMQIASTEVFGPVLSVLKTGSEDEAIDIANSTEYGFVGGIFTADIHAAHRAARRIRAGQFFINEWYAGGVETPFGGYGKSGYGREKGREAL